MEYDHLYVQLELCDGTLADQFTASMRKAARDRERDERSGGADSQSNASMPDALDDPEDADAFVFGEREILVVMRHVALALSAARVRASASRLHPLARCSYARCTSWNRLASPPLSG